MKNLENAIWDTLNSFHVLHWTYTIEGKVVTFRVPNSTRFLRVEFEINVEEDSILGQVLEYPGFTRRQMDRFMSRLMSQFEDPNNHE